MTHDTDSCPGNVPAETVADDRNRGVGVAVVHEARDGALDSRCEFLHVGFEKGIRSFDIDACGFQPTLGGLMELT